MGYKVLIPTAGLGSRLGNYTKFLNKSLVSINLKPTISYQIEKFPKDTEFVIALGYKGNLVKQFLEIAYPKNSFTFVEVDIFKGPGSGLGLSILKCKEYLNEPFVFISCDTLVDEDIPQPSSNWMAYAKVENNNQYRSLKIYKNKVIDILEKDKYLNSYFPYIGMAGINNTKDFWDQMIAGGDKAIEMGESYALKKLCKSIEINSYEFTWHDTGNLNSLKKVREYLREENDPIILEKENESIWFVDNKVIKYSDDKQFIKNRVLRSRVISKFVPLITDFTDNMYAYKKVDGKVLSEVITLTKFKELLNFCNYFWKDIKLKPVEIEKFKKNCLKFYKSKTLLRIDLFFKKFEHIDSITFINDQRVPKVKDLLERVDWDELSFGKPSYFHGDFHFENILFDKENKNFIFLDWRQDFASDIVCGDRYYDFAKLMHGLIVNHRIVEKNLFSVNWKGDILNFDINRKFSLVECENYFNFWLKENSYSTKKVNLLTSLIYLNIAGLHHYPYSELLFGLGKSMLFQNI